MHSQDGRILPWISRTNDDDDDGQALSSEERVFKLGIELHATYGLSCWTAEEKETENIHLP